MNGSEIMGFLDRINPSMSSTSIVWDAQYIFGIFDATKTDPIIAGSNSKSDSEVESELDSESAIVSVSVAQKKETVFFLLDQVLTSGERLNRLLWHSVGTGVLSISIVFICSEDITLAFNDWKMREKPESPLWPFVFGQSDSFRKRSTMAET